MSKSEALRLADVSRLSRHHEWHLQVDAELRRLHAERAAADGVINDLVVKVRELQKENESLAAALASSCDEQRHELWESGGVAGCERARVAERQRDALLEALKAMLEAFNYHTISGIVHDESAAIAKARAAQQAVEGGK